MSKFHRCLTAFAFALALRSGAMAQSINEASGFVTVNVKGTGGTVPSALSFLSIGLARPAAYQGTVSSINTSMLGDSQANWNDGQFNGRNGEHYVEITSGPKAGLITGIIDTKGSEHALILADDLAGVIESGEKFVVRKHWTLAALFGARNETGLGEGSNLTADEILIYHPTLGTYTTYFYKTIGLGGTGWRSTVNASTDESQAKLDLTQGLIIRRKQPGDLSLRIFGALRSGNTLIEVRPGLNLLANVYPGGTMTLANSHLYTGDSSTGLAGGSNLTADRVLIFDGTTYRTFYYKTTGLGGTGWRSTSSASIDASSTIIPAGSSVLVQRLQNRGAFFWVVEAPF